MADSQWDADNFDPKGFDAPRIADKWEGEDEEDDIKDNWDDDEEEQSEEPKKITENNEVGKAVQVKKKSKLKEKMRLAEEARVAEEEEPPPVLVLTPQEMNEEKLRRQQLQEESDLELAKEAFGIHETKTIIDGIDPTSREDFDQLKKNLVEKLTRYEKSSCYLPFLEDLIRDLCINLDADEIKKLGSTLNALSSEKAKAAKAGKSKKKASTKKASLVVGKASDFDFDDYGNADVFDDFM